MIVQVTRENRAECAGEVVAEAGGRLEIRRKALCRIPSRPLLGVEHGVVTVADVSAVVGGPGVPMHGKVGDQAAGKGLRRDAWHAAAAEDHSAAAVDLARVLR
ncbi:hypothetical protein C7T36_16775 [Rhodococcus sp. AD45-ID]|nr:hypothetical protein C7T36_16775 [Rhodococcus sp. AD45-ID]